MLNTKPTKLEAEIDLYIQQNLINIEWPFFKTRLKNDTLYVLGEWKDRAYRHNYKFLVRYKSNKKIEARIIEPEIKAKAEIHVNSDGTLCLYHRRDYSFNKKFIISREIIPWILEWTFWYEVYLINGGIWQGSEADHG